MHNGRAKPLPRRAPATRRFEVRLSERLPGEKRTLFRTTGVGEPGPFRIRGLLSGTSSGVFAKRSALFWRTRTGGHVADRRTGHPHDPGVASSPAWIASLLY